jgi:DNA replication and repair protein RecF
MTPPAGIRRLRLQGFRNLKDAELHLPPEGVALVGANAQGKSNFLEAIHYLDTFRSFRGAPDAQLIRFDAAFFRVEAERAVGGSGDAGGARGSGDAENAARAGSAGHADRAAAPAGWDGPRQVAAAFQREGAVKRVSLDGEVIPRLGDALGSVGTVLFTPDDVRLVSDGPAERRRFLDMVLSVNVPGYLGALQRYRQVLNQRNAALRERTGRGAVSAWDPLLVESGARVMALRNRWVLEGGPRFTGVVEEISGGEGGWMHYLPALTGSGVEPGALPAEEDGWAEAFARALAASAGQEWRRGTTVVGPHRDEVRLVGGPSGDAEPAGTPRDLRDYGSGGQRRTAALALRILEAETVLDRTGRPAVLLLDDVFAELDEPRSGRVLGLLERTAAGQVILTAPKDSEIHFRHDRLPRWRIEGGRIREEGSRGGDAEETVPGGDAGEVAPGADAGEAAPGTDADGTRTRTRVEG